MALLLTSPSNNITFILVGLLQLLTNHSTAALFIYRPLMDQIYQSFILIGVSYESGLVGNETFYMSERNLQSLIAFESHDSDGNPIDQSLVAKVDNICYGVFRGSVGSFFGPDWGQNLNLGTAGEGSCFARLGYYEAYVNEYQTAFDNALDTCINSCVGGDCPLVLSGFSQGGAAAVIASIFWSHKNPKVISFGAPRVVRAPCNYINPENHFRIITANNDNFGMWYDPIVMVTGVGAVHFGHPIIIGSDPNSAYQPASPGINNDQNRDPVDLAFAAHQFLPYRDRVRWMNEYTNFPIKAIGFKNGVQCGFNDECESGRCKGSFPPYRCRSKVGSCGRCNENSDCESGICLRRSTQSVCAEPDGKMANNCYCNFNNDCQSGRCEGFFPPYQCHGRLGRGSSCNEHSDCQSNNCFEWKCA